MLQWIALPPAGAMYEWTSEWTDGGMDERTNERMNERMEWMKGWYSLLCFFGFSMAFPTFKVWCSFRFFERLRFLCSYLDSLGRFWFSWNLSVCCFLRGGMTTTMVLLLQCLGTVPHVALRSLEQQSSSCSMSRRTHWGKFGILIVLCKYLARGMHVDLQGACSFGIWAAAGSNPCLYEARF